MNLHEEIAMVAYELFEREGREHGKDSEHWLEAEKIVRMRHAARHPSQKDGPKTSTASKVVGAKKAPAAKKAVPKTAVPAPKEKTSGK